MENLKREFIGLPDVEPQEAEPVHVPVETATNPERSLRQRWSGLVQGVRENYRHWKKHLVERTDETLAEMADLYVGDWQREQPTTMLQSAQRSVEAAQQSLTLRKTIDLALRGALVGMEFQAQMAAKQLFVDLAIRQADCDALAEKYANHGGVQAVETEALKFADAVRQQFEELQRVSERMMPEAKEDREAYRQRHIEHGMTYANQLLENVNIIPEQRRQAILADIRRHLDTVVFDTEKSKLLRGYDKLSGQWRNAIQGIMERHIDVYQARKARNLSALTSGARWMTLGVESFVIGKTAAAYASVSTNYEKALQQRPAQERSTAQRLLALAEGTKASLKQFALHDRFTLALQNNKTLTAEVRAAVTQLITPDQQAAAPENLDVDTITNQLWQTFGPELTKRGTSELDLHMAVQDLRSVQGDRRKALEHLMRYRMLALHRETIKASAQQFEHLFQQASANIAAIGMLEVVDVTIEHHYEVVTGEIESALSQLEQGVGYITVTPVAPAEHLTVPTVPEPDLPVVPAVMDISSDLNDAVPPESKVSNVHYVVESGETAWKIATDHLEWYRQREGNDHLTVPQAIALLQHDNNLTNAARIEVGQQLLIPSEPLFVDTTADTNVLPSGVWEQDRFISTEQALMFARGVDHHIVNEHYVSGATRADLAKLPPGDYVAVFGERMGRRSGTMGVHYDQSYDVHVDATGQITTKEHGVTDTTPDTLTDLLAKERAPIVRVFSMETTELNIEHGRLNPSEWSVYNLAQISYMQHNNLEVLDIEGTYCAKDMGGRFNLFADRLAEAIGVNILDGEGNISGVTVHAPMVAEAMISAGGQELSSLAAYYKVDQAGSHPLEKPATENAIYRQHLDQWITAAAASPLEVATFFNTHTHIQDIIAANRDIGGEPNSHVVTLLGAIDHHLVATKDTTIESLLRTRLGLGKSDLAERGYVLETLGIEVNGAVITDETNWLKQTVPAGAEVIVHDVSTNHLYNGVQKDTLMQLLVSRENLLPVSIVEPNAEIVNAALRAENPVDNALMINDFMLVQSGQGLGDMMAAAGISPDLWKAAEFALAQRGITPESVQPGDLVPIYDETALRSQLDNLYNATEAKLALETGEVVHIVRPHESMDELTAHFFDQNTYSTAEWSQLRDQLAYGLQIPTGDKAMPGDIYTKPYSVREYHLQANTILHMDENQLADLDRHIWEARAAERVYLPESLPIATEAGVVKTALPTEVVRLIDTVVDSNPNYGEPVRVALALVYANEGMRETADKNWISEAINWTNEHLPNRSATLDAAIERSEYFTSRQTLKDLAWGIQDEPMAKAMLDFVVAQGKAGVAERAAQLAEHPTLGGAIDVLEDQYIIEPVLGKLETIAGISSAGIFQVRANNFLDEGSPSFADFERDLRTDPLLNTAAAAEILHRNAQALDTYVAAFGDPQSNNDTAHTLALVNSYNGGPYKTMLGSLQEGLLAFEAHSHIDLPIDRATGRDTAVTREALIAMCDHLRAEGKLDIPPDQVERDVALLGTETVGFLRSTTMQELKVAYRSDMGTDLSVLPRADQLNDANTTYANYAVLAMRGGGLETILQHSQAQRIAKGEAVTFGYSRNDLAAAAVKPAG